jgi:D-tyrosyl-tRNA(Tyr) deacylase
MNYFRWVMRILIQRVSKASVTIDEQFISEINQGLLLFVGIENEDTSDDIEWIASKVVKLRIFNDTDGVMNLSLLDKAADILLVSQFTLHASTKKGNRPSYIKAARPEIAIPIYELLKIKISELIAKPIKTGQFGADMQVALINDGPVTIWIDSKDKF